MLAVVVAAAALLIAWLVGGRVLSPDVISNAVIAGCVCFIAATIALGAVYLGNRWQAPVQGVLVGMLARMGLPLAALVALPEFGGAFAAPGMATTVLGVYLVSLVVETLLSLRLVPPSQLPHTASRKA